MDSLFGTPGRIRTYDLWLRKPTLYPAELRVHNTRHALILIRFETYGFGHVPRPRNFLTVSIAYNLKDFLANCHWQFSPTTFGSASQRSIQLSYGCTSGPTISLHISKNIFANILPYGRSFLSVFQTVINLPGLKNWARRVIYTYSPYLLLNRTGVILSQRS
jgi:hypothetical protein